MKTHLSKLLGISEERTNLLLLLYGGSRKKETIQELLGISRQALVPHMKHLEENGLITKRNDAYELTSIGKIVLSEMMTFSERLDFLDSNSDVLTKYKIDFIPPFLLERFHELGPLSIREPHFLDVFEPDKEFMSTVSTSVSVIITFSFPAFRKFSSQIMDKGVDMHVILSQELLKKLIAEQYDDFKWFLESEHSVVYLYSGKLDFVSFGLNESSIMFRLFDVVGDFDNNLITASGQGAVEWGKEFFEYYKKRSTPVTEI
ncbi:transcriptional regulator FilR1 domain-containing protein [Methanolobus sp. ZRKC2]|uniref:helix-turn-helix transcriptional regulator n=1 Tax=Methanolobus sp. ZRKC2 TaxID=3125783 RepID=UPI00324ED9CD